MEEPPQGVPPGRVDSFGTRLRLLRESAGLTQEELAEKAGLSPAAVSVLERGERKRPYAHTVRALAEALGLSGAERASLLSAVPKRDANVPAAPPPVYKSTLPSPATPLIGREKELHDLRELIENSGARLLTLTGVGGAGKTRLAVAAAQEVEGNFPDGIAFVALAPLRDPTLVVSMVLRSLNLTEEGQAPGEALINHLKGKRKLLVLDNFEHLLDAAAGIAGLIEACPELVLIATNRAPLRLRGEQEYLVPPLALPSSTRNLTEAEVLATPAGRLFIDRARAASPSFTVRAENANAVAAICWRLAGLPLALELAAAKVRFLEPAALLPRLDQALSTAWARDLPERQRTMRAVLDWSFELLPKPQQGLFRRLAVFAGGFSLEAAEAVGAANEQETVLELLETLIEQSLVQVQLRQDNGEMRYSMLEPVRQYALEGLTLSRKSVDAFWRHAEFFLALAERAAPELWGPGQAGWFNELERENGNLRAAISWALATGKAEIAGRLCWALWLFWWARGYHLEGRQWAEAALGQQLPPAWRARVLPVAATMSYGENDHETAEQRWRGGLDVSLQEGDLFAEGYARTGIGLVHLAHGDPQAAATSLGEALPLLKRYEESLVSLVHVWLGTAALVSGDPVRAEREIEEGLRSARTRGDSLCTYIALYNLAQLALARNDLSLAAHTLDEGIQLSGQTKDKANLAYFLEALATITALRGEMEHTARLLGAAEGVLQDVGAPIYNYYVSDLAFKKRAVAEARAVLGNDTFDETLQQGREMTFEQALAYALSADSGLKGKEP